MANRIILNTVSFHGKGAIGEIPGIARTKGFRHVFVCSDPDLVKFGVTAKALDAMKLYLECTMNYEREGDPVKMWFFWFQRGVDSYQIELRAGDGVIEYIRYDDNSLGKG